MQKALATLAVIALTTVAAHAQISLTGSTYTQNFDSLANTGSSASLPAGWAFLESGANANTVYAANNGGSTTGDTYSYGASAGATLGERAYGTLLSGNLGSQIGAQFTNNTGSAVTQLDISYIGEQWRNGTSDANVDRLDFQYSLDATSLATSAGTWIAFDSLDFNSPTNQAAASLLDGNLAANQVALSQSITGLNIANGTNFWIRWTDFNVAGTDDGLAVDTFSIGTVPEPATYLLLGVGLLLCGQRFFRRASSK